ncbi:hypothetical protein AVEN_96045-1 [Araneus ventricosus]|uniref:Retropepsins domain-containing protein n=1 Tax=Araneus ventricosus TaxID=182803 RepID=A0A4Y2B396_ARAVE|nr:hypothetical protein AVEN_96045-1 [Araneus ventricosus]
MSTSLQLESKTTRKSEKLKSAVSSVTNSGAENVKKCRKFRLFVRDRRSNLHFLVDSGADVSIMLATPQNKKKVEYQLYSANGTEISTYGIKMLNLDLGLHRDFQFPFIIADITKCILGANFLHKFNLLVDINKKKLIDGITNFCALGDITAISSDNVVSTLNKFIKFSNLLFKYPEISRPNLIPKQIKHNVKHFSATNGQHIHAKARHLDPKRLAIAKEEFAFMLNNEKIEP